MHHSLDKHNRRGWLLPNLTICALLAIIVAGGAWLRFGHGDWDGGNQLHPDERGILFVAQRIELPSSLVDALNPSRSSLNPFRTSEGVEQDYPYGHLPLYTIVITQRLLSWICPMAEQACKGIPAESFWGRMLNVDGLPRFDHLMAAGRALSALFDTLTIVAVWLLARELAGERTGLIAAWLCSVAVLHIQNAHFGTVDTTLAVFATLSVWLLTRYVRTQRRRDAVLAGVFAGLALGCKASAMLLVVPIGAAYLTRNSPALDEKGLRQRLRVSCKREVWLTLGAALVAFVLTNPYAVLDPGPFLNGLVTQAAMTSGATDWPFTRQYIGTTLLYPIEQQARWGLGLPLTLAAYGGLVWGARRAVKEHSRALMVAGAWAAALVVESSVQLVKFPRYLLLVTPTLIALGGAMLTIPWASNGKVCRVVRWLRGACLVMVMVLTALYALAFEGMYQQPHPWVAASEWIYQELPAGTRIAIEAGDDALPLDLTMDGQLLRAGEHVEACTTDPFAEPDDEAKLGRALECLARVDFLILSSNRAYGVIPRLAGRYPLTSAYYRALFDGGLGFDLERSFERHPSLLGWHLVDDPFRPAGLANPLGGWAAHTINLGPADESFTVYDHPLVLVFTNREHLSARELRQKIVQSAAGD